MQTRRIDNVQVFTSDGCFKNGSVEFGETIHKIDVFPNGCGEDYLIPGLIDIHTHGAMGGGHTEGSRDKMDETAGFYAKNGTTSFLATTLTAGDDVLENAVKNAASYVRKPSGARCLGVYLEGPFFSSRKRGAHPKELLKAPDIDMLEWLCRISGEWIKIVAVSPELDGAMGFIREASKKCSVSLAHSACDYKTAMQAFGCGAKLVTHLFNGMEPFLHREPGLVGAALDSCSFVELICDGHHLHPSVVRAAFKLFPGKLCLISDSLSCAGLPDGSYESAGLQVDVKNGCARLSGSNTIAGSTTTLLQCVRNAVSLGVSLREAVYAATHAPASLLGVLGKVGTISAGANADFLLLDSGLNVKQVYIGGKEIYTNYPPKRLPDGGW